MAKNADLDLLIKGETYINNYIFLKAKLKKYLKNRYRSLPILKMKIELILRKNQKIIDIYLKLDNLKNEDIEKLAKKLIERDKKCKAK